MRSGKNSYQLELTDAQEDPEWDAFVVASMDPHPEQTSMWREAQRLCGWSPLRLIARRGSKIVGGVQLLERPLRQFGKVAYLNRGPLLAANDPALANLLLDGLKHLGRQRRIIYLAFILPYSGQFLEGALINAGFVIRPEVLPPTTPMTSTIVLDLKPGLDELLMGMRPSTRQNVRKAEKRAAWFFDKGPWAILETFNNLLLELCRRRMVEPNVPQGAFLNELWMAMAPKDYLKVFLTQCGNEPVGALLLFTMGGWARLWRIGWSEEFESRTDWGVTDVVCVLPLAAQSPFHNQPDRLAGESIFAQSDASFGKFIFNGSLGSLGNLAPIPEEGMYVTGQCCKVDRLFLGFRNYRFGSTSALSANLSFFSGRSLEPAQSIGWH